MMRVFKTEGLRVPVKSWAIGHSLERVLKG